jgi:hypothetical protein
MLKKRLTLLIGITYLFLIPLYGWLYYSLPNNFYQSTMQLEKYVSSYNYELEDNLISEIKEALFKNINFPKQKCYLVSPKDTFVILRIGLNHNLFFIKDDSVHFSCYIAADKLNKHEKYFSEFTVNLSFPLHENSDLDQNDSIIRYPTFSYNSLFDETPYTFIIPESQMKDLDLECNPVWLTFTKSFKGQLNSYAVGLNGIVFDKDYWKMFYLSAITITTLGFGDIVPVTPLARGLISSEAILGVVVIGLFFWSLARDVSKKISFRPR